MMFHSVPYLVFLMVVFGIYWAVAKHKWPRLAVLLGASIVFYSAMHPYPLIVFFLYALVNFGAGQLLERTENPTARKAIMGTAVVLHMTGLLGYKYLNMVLRTLGDIGRALHVENPPEPIKLLLPVGLSFMAFHAISFVVDVYRRETSGRFSLLHQFTFLLFFPCVVAGPIIRSQDLLEHFDEKPRLTPEEGATAIFRIAQGIAKKMLLADVMAFSIVDPVFSNPTGYTSVENVIAAIAYTFQIYFDFSALSDIAIGSAALFGFHFPENFNKPHHGRNLFEFWNRWHISLSTWLRDYFHRPMGGTRGTKFQTLRNTMLVMSFGGLWHGTDGDWRFMLWGTIHGVLLCLLRVKWWYFGKPDYTQWWRAALGIFGTFWLVVFPRIYFRADTIPMAHQMFGQMFRFIPGIERITTMAWVSMGAGLLLYVLPAKVFELGMATFVKLPAPVRAVALVGLGLLIASLANIEAKPYIYLQF